MNGLQNSLAQKEAIEKAAIAEVELLATDRKQMLFKIHESAQDNLAVAEGQRASATIARFATLLVSLSQQADKQFEENSRLQRENMEIQRRLLSLTRWIVALTIALFFIALVQTIVAFKH